MKITPITDKPRYLLPAAALLTSGAAMISCQQQTGGQVSPGAPPASFTADAAAASAECTIPASVRSADKGRQRLADKNSAQ